MLQKLKREPCKSQLLAPLWHTGTWSEPSAESPEAASHLRNRAKLVWILCHKRGEISTKLCCTHRGGLIFWGDEWKEPEGEPNTNCSQCRLEVISWGSWRKHQKKTQRETPSQPHTVHMRSLALTQPLKQRRFLISCHLAWPSLTV